MESFRANRKCALIGTFHKASAKHLHRSVAELAGHRKARDSGTIDETESSVVGLFGRHFMCRDPH